MRLVPLTPDYPLTAFDCGDDDLNKFLLGFYDGTNDRYFCGDFDGGGHTISGIRIYKGGSDYADKYQGLFGQTGAGANIHDVTLADIRITGYDNTGGIVGYNGGGTVSDCHAPRHHYHHRRAGVSCARGHQLQCVGISSVPRLPQRG